MYIAEVSVADTPPFSILHPTAMGGYLVQCVRVPRLLRLDAQLAHVEDLDYPGYIAGRPIVSPDGTLTVNLPEEIRRVSPEGRVVWRSPHPNRTERGAGDLLLDEHGLWAVVPHAAGGQDLQLIDPATGTVQSAHHIRAEIEYATLTRHPQSPRIALSVVVGFGSYSDTYWLEPENGGFRIAHLRENFSVRGYLHNGQAVCRLNSGSVVAVIDDRTGATISSISMADLCDEEVSYRTIAVAPDLIVASAGDKVFALQAEDLVRPFYFGPSMHYETVDLVAAPQPNQWLTVDRVTGQVRLWRAERQKRSGERML